MSYQGLCGSSYFCIRFQLHLRRGNCKVGLYCDSQKLVCMQMKNIGEACDGDKEYAFTSLGSSTLTTWTGRCSSFNCQSNGVCGISADTPKQFGIWVYVLVGVGIVGGT